MTKTARNPEQGLPFEDVSFDCIQMCAVPSARGIHHVKTIQPTDSSQIPDRSELMIKIHRYSLPSLPVFRIIHPFFSFLFTKGGFLVFFEPDQSISRKLQKCGPALAETLDEQPKSWSIAHELEHVIYNSKDSSGSAPLFEKGDIKPFFLPIGTWPKVCLIDWLWRDYSYIVTFKDPRFERRWVENGDCSDVVDLDSWRPVPPTSRFQK
ncbi:hypothetical protein JVU11DRAFT_12590 [Chiua virens]|nr:hypothetical protein JVU11DRAFT_12590 [Chiua virens]